MNAKARQEFIRKSLIQKIGAFPIDFQHTGGLPASPLNNYEASVSVVCVLLDAATNHLPLSFVS